MLKKLMLSAVLAVSVQSVQAEDNVKGSEVYNQACVMCHAAGISNAPLVHNQQQWNARKEKGMDVLLQNAISGINQMPPRGLCMTCSDEDLQAAIEYMMAEGK